MKIEFLQDYHAREEELRKEFNLRVEDGRFGPRDIFPAKERFHKLQEPHGVSYPLPEIGIWPQIPMYGSLIIPIFPVIPERFEDHHGFEPKYLDQFIDLCKDTGRVQFTLVMDPLNYESLDYLEPVLTELNPPVQGGTPMDALASQGDLRRWGVQFETLAGFGFYGMVDSILPKIGVRTVEDYPHWHTALRRWYIYLRAKGLDGIAEEVDNTLVDNPRKALALLSCFGSYLIAPATDTLRSIRNFPKELTMEFTKAAKERGIDAGDITMPCEIGSFLMENLTFVPKGLEACKDLITRYSHRDLYEVMKAINEAAMDKKPDLLESESVELNRILGQVWDDAGGMKTNMTIAEIMVPLAIAIPGIIASPFVGLLGALGFSIADKVLSATGESLSEKIVGSISGPSMFTLYNFKKRYGLDRRPLS